MGRRVTVGTLLGAYIINEHPLALKPVDGNDTRLPAPQFMWSRGQGVTPFPLRIGANNTLYHKQTVISNFFLPNISLNDSRYSSRRFRPTYQDLLHKRVHIIWTTEEIPYHSPQLLPYFTFRLQSTLSRGIIGVDTESEVEKRRPERSTFLLRFGFRDPLFRVPETLVR